MEELNSKKSESNKLYEARWVWYHTILAVELLAVIVLVAAHISKTNKVIELLEQGIR